MSVYEEKTYSWLAAEKNFIAQAIKAAKPVLGICLGAQLLAAAMGARVFKNDQREIGWFDIFRCPGAEHSRTAGFLPEKSEVFHWHGDTFELPAGAVALAQSPGCRHQGFVAGERFVGLQFHLEMTHDGAARLIEHCRNDLQPPGPWVQEPGQILADRQRFQKANQMLVPLLDRLGGLAA
jgi:GMP synthase (glutamine-hydrolysing)